MKTRREFFKLFGKVALVGGVVAAVPGARQSPDFFVVFFLENSLSHG